MAKMTTLHFASPFAVSMPLPVAPAVRVVRASSGTAEDEPDGLGAPVPEDGDATLFPIGTDRVSLLAMDGPIDPIGRADPTLGTYDAVVRRYGEAREAGSDRDGSTAADDGAARALTVRPVAERADGG